MPDWITEQVLIAGISALSGIAVAIVAGFFAFRGKLAEIGAYAREAKEQVTNSHSTNFREEQDEYHQTVMGELREIRRDVRGTREDIGILHGVDRELRKDVAATQKELHQHLSESRRSIELADRTASTVERFLPLLTKHGIDPGVN